MVTYILLINSSTKPTEVLAAAGTAGIAACGPASDGSVMLLTLQNSKFIRVVVTIDRVYRPNGHVSLIADNFGQAIKVCGSQLDRLIEQLEKLMLTYFGLDAA